jgi:hypothetical protein
VIPVRAGAVISGTLLFFDHKSSEELLASLRRVGRKAARGATKLAAELGRPEATKAIRALLTPERQLSEAPFLFTNLWLERLLENQSGSRVPEISNSDGEPFAFITLHFPLLPDARDALRGARDKPLASAGERQVLELVGSRSIHRRSGPVARGVGRHGMHMQPFHSEFRTQES